MDSRLEGETKMNYHKQIRLSYDDMGGLIGVINMYCNGPKYFYHKKTLSHLKRNHANQISQRLIKMKEKIRDLYPELYVSRPYPEEALNKCRKLSLTREEVSMLRTIFTETMKESEHDGYYDLELLAAPITQVRKVFDLIVQKQADERNGRDF